MQPHTNPRLAPLLAPHRSYAGRPSDHGGGAHLDGGANPDRRGGRARRAMGALVAVLGVPILAISALAAPGQSEIAAVRAATDRYHDLAAAEAAGYGPFYVCTDEEGVGTMGQHYVNLDLVLDPVIDPLRPEALVYEPRQGGGYRLVAVEYVAFQDAWHEAFGAATPTVLGVDLRATGPGNRYGLPPFYQRHLWLWAPNPLGMYEDWNPSVTCRGTGD
ncbi:MAG TPA: hypothetical protein VFX65_01050 [Candidatus Limnocylindrales bacterium]|nr:hypothetical protein [Candidatus Limnocylindrales bacterium]